MLKLSYARVVVIVAIFGFLLLPCTAARAALILYYNLSEGTGTAASDLSASGNNGTVGGGWTTPGPATPGSAHAASILYSDAASVVTTSSAVTLGSGDFTTSLWFKGSSNAGGWRFLVSDVASVDDKAGLLIMTSDDHLRISMGTWIKDVLDPHLGSATFTSTDWYNVAVVRSGMTVTAYVNGAFDATGTSNATIGANTIKFGSVGDTLLGMTGAIADIAIWNQALTATQVAAIASGASPLTIIPEPSTLVLVLAGMLGLVSGAWRKRK